MTDPLDDRQKPELDYPGDTPPNDLVVDDLVVGDGSEVRTGTTVTAHYAGWVFSTGEEFDASWNRGEPLSFRVGIGQVIQGWDQGLIGMKVGGRRKLIIPAHLAYGDRGAGGVIGPGDSLVFIVDLVAVR